MRRARNIRADSQAITLGLRQPRSSDHVIFSMLRKYIGIRTAHASLKENFYHSRTQMIFRSRGDCQAISAFVNTSMADLNQNLQFILHHAKPPACLSLADNPTTIPLSCPLHPTTSPIRVCVLTTPAKNPYCLLPSL